MSTFLESIQQSPIDTLISDAEDDERDRLNHATSDSSVKLLLNQLCRAHLFSDEEDQPLDPPIETPLIAEAGFSSPIILLVDSRPWKHQLSPSGDTLAPHSPLTVTPVDLGIVVFSKKNLNEKIFIPDNGLSITFNNTLYSLSDNGFEDEKTGSSIPLPALKLLHETFIGINLWRSRIVRLSMDTDEYECSLMDDLCPPRTFLVEFKKSVILKSIKIQAGIAYWEIATGRTVSVHSSVLDEEPDVTKFMHQLAPELVLTKPAEVWDDVIQLRAMCLEEDHRLALHQLTSGLTAVSGG
jgi:hypothetical protein